MSSNTKNYAAHGGNEWVIGGKLTILPGAQVEGLTDLLDISIEPDPLEAATTDAIGGVMLAANQADSTASTVAGLKDDLNALLAKLKAAGVMAADASGE